MTNPFSWDYLTASASETSVWGPLSIAYVFIFLTGLFIAVFFSYDAPQRLRNRQLLLRTIQRGTWIAIPVFGIGLFFFLLRVLEVTAFGLDMRIWLYICALAALIMVGYFWYYIRTVYPRLAAAEEAEMQRRAYIERPAHGRSGGGSRKRSRKKKRA